MSDESSETRPKWAAIIVGMVLAFVLAVVMANQAPAVLALLATMAFLGWVGVRLGVLATDDGGDEDEPAGDPLAVLQERYAAGEITEAEFERRLETILETEELAERAPGTHTGGAGSRRTDEAARPDAEREPATER